MTRRHRHPLCGIRIITSTIEMHPGRFTWGSSRARECRRRRPPSRCCWRLRWGWNELTEPCARTIRVVLAEGLTVLCPLGSGSTTAGSSDPPDKPVLAIGSAKGRSRWAALARRATLRRMILVAVQLSPTVLWRRDRQRGETRRDLASPSSSWRARDLRTTQSDEDKPGTATVAARERHPRARATARDALGTEVLAGCGRRRRARRVRRAVDGPQELRSTGSRCTWSRWAIATPTRATGPDSATNACRSDHVLAGRTGRKDGPGRKALTRSDAPVLLLYPERHVELWRCG